MCASTYHSRVSSIAIDYSNNLDKGVWIMASTAATLKEETLIKVTPVFSHFLKKLLNCTKSSSAVHSQTFDTEAFNHGPDFVTSVAITQHLNLLIITYFKINSTIVLLPLHFLLLLPRCHWFYIASHHFI